MDQSADGSISPQTKNFRPYHNDIISIYYLTVYDNAKCANDLKISYSFLNSVKIVFFVFIQNDGISVHFLAHLWCAYAIPLALSVVCVVSSNLTTADMKEII